MLTVNGRQISAGQRAPSARGGFHGARCYWGCGPVFCAGTVAVFFAALNLSKVPACAWLGQLDLRNAATSLLLLPLPASGVWTGVWLTQRISVPWLYRLAYVGMALTRSQLLWDGLKSGSPIEMWREHSLAQALRPHRAAFRQTWA